MKEAIANVLNATFRVTQTHIYTLNNRPYPLPGYFINELGSYFKIARYEPLTLL